MWTKPPGNAHSPAEGGSSRRITSTDSAPSATVSSTRSTVTEGRSKSLRADAGLAMPKLPSYAYHSYILYAPLSTSSVHGRSIAWNSQYWYSLRCPRPDGASRFGRVGRRAANSHWDLRRGLWSRPPQRFGSLIQQCEIAVVH